MDPITAVGLVASIVQLIGTTAKSIQYANEVRKAPKEVFEFSQESSNLLSLLFRLRSRVEETHNQYDPWINGIAALGSKNGVLDQLKETIKAIVDKLAGAQKLGKRILWPLDKKEFNALLARIERLKSLISLALQDNVIELSQIISSNTANLPVLGQEVSSIKETLEEQDSRALDEQYRRVIEWLSPLNFSAVQIETLQKREKGTGTWILQDQRFKKWVDGTGSFLCCQGIPGSGKTILASVVTDALQRLYSGSDAVRVACIYCRYSERDSQSPTDIIASLWRQIADIRKPLSQDTKELYMMNLNQGTRPNLDAMFALLQMEVKTRSKIFIIVDALDEYTAEQGLRSILLEKLRALKPCPNLMITSRAFEDDLVEQYYSCGLQISAREQDMYKYITGRIQRDERLSRHVARDNGLEELISSTIIDRAKDMFLMATLHMDSLVSKHNPRAVRTALENLPAGLEDTYQKVLQRIDSQNADDREMANTVLLWLCCAQRPLTLSELQHALSLDTDCLEFDPQSVTEQDLLLSICAGLVIVDPESGIIRLVHYTAQEFFEGIRDSRFADAQRTIVSTCLQYLSFNAFNGYSHKRRDLKERLDRHPFLAYAASFWGCHLRGPLETILSDQVLKFLNDKAKVSSASQILVQLACGWETKPSAPEEKASGLSLAAYFGLTHIATLLLENSVLTADGTARAIYINSYDQSYGTALHWAALGNNESSLELLLAEKGTNQIIDQRNCFTNTALFEAVRNSRGRSIRVLMKNGADVSVRGNGNTLPPLHEAAFHGCAEDIRVLLESNERTEMLHQRANEGHTALHCAASRNHHSACKVLLDCGASLYDTDMHGKTPLHAAADHGANRTAGLIIDRDHSLRHLSIRARNRRTAFQSACLLGHTQVAALLLRTEVKMQLLEEVDGYNSLQSAATNGQAAMVKLLLDHSTRPLPVDESGANLFHLAVRSGDVATVRLLVVNKEYKEMLRARTFSGSTAVHDAARRGHVEVMKLLAEEGADLDAKDNRGRTALHNAARNDLDTMAAVLLSAGAGIEVKDHQDQTPLLLALKAHSSNTAGLLLASNALKSRCEDPELKHWAQQQPWWKFFDGQTTQYHIPYQPATAQDVFHAHFCLQNTLLSLLPNASHIIRTILEIAEYWITSKVVHAEKLRFTMHDGDFIYLRSRPIAGRAICPVQKIVVTTTSKDQGWSGAPGHGSYDGSFTWFNIALQREGAPVKPFNLTTNIHAGQSMKKHTMRWTQNGRLGETSDWLESNGCIHNLEIAKWVRELRRGDRIVVIPKALHRGWTNIVKRVEITVYTSCLLPAVQSHGGLVAGSDVTTAKQQVTVPSRHTYVGGFYFWGTSSAGFSHEIPTLWTVDDDVVLRYSE